MHKIIWLTGQSGAGKTAVGKPLAEHLKGVLLDGDEMRSSISLGAGFSREDRKEHNLRVARLALVLAQYTPVVVAVIAPMAEVRKEITEICGPHWVYIKRNLPEREGHFYEEPSHNYLDCGFALWEVDHDELLPEESLQFIMKFIVNEEKKIYSLFIGRWQCLPLHQGHLDLFDTVRKEGKNILIAIRDTKVDEKNPYTVQERLKGVKEAVPDAKVIVIPDITEVCYGRGVGYGIREIVLDDTVQAISGTEMREQGKG